MADSIEIVEAGEYRVSDERLATYSATACIILAALNIRDKNGLLGHFTHEDVHNGQLIGRALRAIPLLGPSEDTYIHLAGGGIYFPDAVYPQSHEDNESVRQRVRWIAEEHGIPLPNIEVGWLWGNDEAAAEVDPANGVITVTEELNRRSLDRA